MLHAVKAAGGGQPPLPAKFPLIGKVGLGHQAQNLSFLYHSSAIIQFVIPFIPDRQSQSRHPVSYTHLDVYKRQGLFLSMIRQGLFYVPFILILPKLLGVTGIYLTQPAAHLLTILVCLCSIRSMKRIASANMNQLPEGG